MDFARKGLYSSIDTAVSSGNKRLVELLLCRFGWQIAHGGSRGFSDGYATVRPKPTASAVSYWLKIEAFGITRLIGRIRMEPS
jgi:hypothetical protein